MAQTREERLEYMRKWRERNRKRLRAQARSYYRRNKETVKARNKAWADANAERVRERRRGYYQENKDAFRDSFLRRRYGIGIEDWNALLEAQDGNCAACGEPEGEESAMRFHLDHCHSTGKVCGIIHSRCNRLAGMAGDDPEIVGRIAEYLRRTRAS